MQSNQNFYNHSGACLNNLMTSGRSRQIVWYRLC